MANRRNPRPSTLALLLALLLLAVQWPALAATTLGAVVWLSAQPPVLIAFIAVVLVLRTRTRVTR